MTRTWPPISTLSTQKVASVGLNEPLRPGRYEARLGLEDNERGFQAASRPLPLVVEGSLQAE